MRAKLLVIWAMVVVVTFVLVSWAAAQVTESVAVVFKLRGELQLKRFKQVEWVPSAEGDSLGSGDRLRTGVNSLAAIKFIDGSFVKLRDNTELVINMEPVPEGFSKRLFMEVGNLWAKVATEAGPFEVETPTSVAAIKGTEFYLAEQAGKTILHVIEGFVELANPIGSVLVSAGFSAISTSTEAPYSFPTPPGELPTWAEMVEEVPEVPSPPEEVPPPAEELPPPEEKAPPPKPEEAPPKPEVPGFTMEGAIGTAVMDGKLWNSISLRPDIPIWKFGLGLDLTFYIDQDGNIREKDWDELGDIPDKIYYIRYGHKGEPLYVRAGALPSVTLGYGLIMDGYSNTIEYPTTKRVGVELEIKHGKLGFNGMVNTIREFGLFGGRVHYRAHRFLEIGATVVMDRNQYAGLSLKDTDDDGRIDELDAFPEDDKRWLDTDGDGIDDDVDPDVDNNGYIEIDTTRTALKDSLKSADIPYEHFTVPKRDSEPFNYKEAEAKEALIYGVDIGAPIIERPGLNVVLYGQFAKIDGAGSGFALPGLRVGMGPVKFLVEYRSFQEEFLSGYFDQTYELERVEFEEEADSLVAVTKKENLEDYPALNGIYSALGFSLLGMVDFLATYEDLRGSPDDKSFSAQANLYPVALPMLKKLTKVSGYYRQSHVENLFEFATESTVWGYTLGYQISPGVALMVNYQVTYADLNGDDDVGDPDEEIKTTSIETVLSF